MDGFVGGGDKDYVLLKNLRVELTGINDGVEEGNGFFSLFFWLYIDKFASLPSAILSQRYPDVTSWVPFLCLDEKKKMKLFPLLFLHKESPDQDNYVLWSPVPVASTQDEFPLKKWVHVGCQVLKDLVRLFVDGEMVGEKILHCLFDKELHHDIFNKLYLVCPNDGPPLQLCIDHSSASDIEDEGGVWSVVGGKASCRRIFSLDVTLSNALGCLVNRKLEVVASLLYADNDDPVEHNSDGEPPLLSSYDGIEYASWDRPANFSNGRSSFKLKISQLSSKCENRLFRIKFTIPGLGLYPFLEVFSPPIRCISRSKTVRAPSLPWKRSPHKPHDVNGSSVAGEKSLELIPIIIHEAEPSPASKRIKLGQDNPFAILREHRSTCKGHDSHACATNADTLAARKERRLENGMDIKPFVSNSGYALQGMSSFPNPVSDSVVFKYCLGGTTERFDLLKEISSSSNEEQLSYFAKQVSTFSGCSHHRRQIELAKILVEEGTRAWTSMSENNNQTLWENVAIKLNEYFLKIARCSRPLLDRDLECLRRLAGCHEIVSQENFERIWAWLYPVACTLSRSEITPMWDSLSPLWIEGFITKEKAESILQGSHGLQDPGTFVLRFPTTRSWPHPDAGSIVVTYVGRDSRIRHRLVSFDSMGSSSETVRGLQDLLLQDPELSKLGRMLRNH